MSGVTPAALAVEKPARAGRRKLPARSRHIVMPMILSFLMSGIVASIATIRATGLTPDLGAIILQAWAMSYIVAFPTALVVMPIVRWIVDLIVEAPGGRIG
ncbi:DUF2798 domain-containing protein [Rhizobium daejeonense]